MIQRTLLIASIFLLFVLMAFAPMNHNKMEALQMGKYSISLNVNDISKSKDFYENLGFEAIDGMGSIDQKWIILTNGEAKIGLFQGLFPTNTITFNPSDGRSIYNDLKAKGITPTFEIGFDKREGLCTFSILDPDGNPILIDQH